MTVVRGEKIRKEFAELRRRHRAAATIQSQVKSKIASRQFKGITDASVVIQSGKSVCCRSCQEEQSQSHSFVIFLQQYVVGWLDDAQGILDG